MQQIKFTNARGESVIIGTSKPYIFESILGIGAGDTELITASPAALDGAVYGGLLLGDREVTVNLHIYGETREAMYRNRQRLIAVLSSVQYKNGAVGRLEYSNDYITVWIPAVVKNGPQKTSRIANYNNSNQVVFYCADPHWRGMTDTTGRITYRSGGLSFPLDIDYQEGVQFGERGYKASVFIDGDSPAPMNISITGPSVCPMVIKESTGEYMRVNKSLADDDTLYIDTDPYNTSVTIAHASGTSSAFGHIDPSSTFLMLDPGENVLRYESGDDTTSSIIVVSAYPRYGGV